MPIITLDLNQQEYNDTWGWVNYYRAHPEYIGIPTGDWNDGNPNYQTRIVLSDYTKARFDQLNAQFPGGTPVPPVDQFADLKLRRKVGGSWAAFQPQFFVESNALKAAYPQLENTISQINNYYGPGGFGNVTGTRLGNDFYFNNFVTGNPEPDINGAADKFILNQPGNPEHIAPPTLVIP